MSSFQFYFRSALLLAVILVSVIGAPAGDEGKDLTQVKVEGTPQDAGALTRDSRSAQKFQGRKKKQVEPVKGKSFKKPVPKPKIKKPLQKTKEASQVRKFPAEGVKKGGPKGKAKGKGQKNKGRKISPKEIVRSKTVKPVGKPAGKRFTKLSHVGVIG